MQMCGLHSGQTHKWEDNIKVAGYSEHDNKMLASMFTKVGISYVSERLITLQKEFWYM
jgi:hypothetical protein